MKRYLLVNLFALLLVCLASCKTLQRVECASKKTVPVTYHDVAKGTYYTVNVPYCDTINLLPKQAAPLGTHDTASALPAVVPSPAPPDTGAYALRFAESGALTHYQLAGTGAAY